jgi:hypothetical protein
MLRDILTDVPVIINPYQPTRLAGTTEGPKMKTFAMMMVTASIYVTAAQLTSYVISDSPISSDAAFTLFVIGMVAGVWMSKRLGWID